MNTLFNVTYEIVTPESAEYGDAEERGFCGKGLTLRESLEEIGCCEGGVEANDSIHSSARWVTFTRTDEDYRTGAETSKSLHFPDSLTASTRKRICRLTGCYGANRQ